jgi:tetratricopeptide (TPR) repeat protein
LDPSAYHRTNLLLHAVNSLLVWSLALGVSGGAVVAAWAAGVLFAVHPVNVEAVNSIALGRGYLLATMFGLAAIRLAVAAAGGSGRWWWGAAVAAALGSLFSHEIGVVAIAGLAAVWWARHPRFHWAGVTAALLSGAAGIIMLMLLAGIVSVGGGEAGRVATTAVLSVRQLILPAPLCLWYDAMTAPRAGWFGSTAVIGLLAAVLLLVMTVIRRADHVRVVAVLALLALAPALARPWLPFPLPSLLGERWLYLPAAYVAIWAALLAHSWLNGIRNDRAGAIAIGAALALFALAGVSGAVYATMQTRHWRDNVTLFEHAVRSCPPSAYLHSALGKAYYDRRDIIEAHEQFRTAAEADPTFARARIGLGLTALETGQPVVALRELSTAIALAPNDADAHNGLGEVYRRLRRHEAAVHEFRQAAALRPWQAVYHWNLALAYADVQRYDDAAAEWARVIATSSDQEERAVARREIERLGRTEPERRAE